MKKKKKYERLLAEQALDMFIFGNIHNHWIRGDLGNNYEVTYAGEEFLVLNRETGKMFQFTVPIKRGGKFDFTEEIKGQEWFVDEEDETGGYKAP